ncbi:hypothetical protein SPHINGO391_390110 [Sphingomonas aurantiaca]|uniref:Uncharacterized protein n=1 Tax=Sphingomonas aurantiaca TaxID=185949 RepID=A0A5E7YRN2_9SPHN|nr:hypothetical protein SPHINGO391_390110 [Sphingomonas aurantiaca]
MPQRGGIDELQGAQPQGLLCGTRQERGAGVADAAPAAAQFPAAAVQGGLMPIAVIPTQVRMTA